MQCVGIGISKFHQDTNRAACWHPFGPVSIWFSLTQKMRGRLHTSMSVYMISCAFKYAYTIHFKLCYLHTWMFISVGWKAAEHSGAPVNQRVPTSPNQESILLPEQQISPQRTRHHRCFGPNQFVVDFSKSFITRQKCQNTKLHLQSCKFSRFRAHTSTLKMLHLEITKNVDFVNVYPHASGDVHAPYLIYQIVCHTPFSCSSLINGLFKSLEVRWFLGLQKS